MFTELQEALASDRALDEAKESTLRTPSRAVLGVQFLFEASNPNWSGSKGKAAKKALVKMKLKELSKRPSTKRVLFFDQYSELSYGITSLKNIPAEKNLPPIEMLSLPVE